MTKDTGKSKLSAQTNNFASVQIFTLGQFKVVIDETPLQFSGKVQRRSLNLFKLLVALGGKNVPDTVVADRLWPEVAGDAAYVSLNSTVYRLRKLLGRKNIIIRQNNLLELNSAECWVDLWELESAIAATETFIRTPTDGIDTAQMANFDDALSLYQGTFLASDYDLPWVKPIADGLRRRLLNRIIQIGEYWEHKEQTGRAVNYYEQAFAIDPCAEDVCRVLMSFYHFLGRPAEVIRIYRQLHESLRFHAGTAPSAQTTALLHALS